MFKFVRKIFLFVLLILVIAGALFWYVVKRDKGSFSVRNAVGYVWDRVSGEAKSDIKDSAKDLESKVYEEATKNNPAGDVLPDSVDDTLKAKLKEELQNQATQ